MILRPLLPNSNTSRNGEAEEAWKIVSRSQNLDAPQYLLVGQPDHAHLSGELASRFRADFLPVIDPVVVKAISVHDDGWGIFPFERDLRGEPELTSGGRPQHFMQVPVEQSLAAWKGSIRSACEVGPLPAFMVSSHFSRIGRMRIQMQVDSPDDIARIDRFVQGEEETQHTINAYLKLPQEKLSEHVDLLQFCDLLSLYLCCGSTEAAEFPQQFGGQQVSIRYEDGIYFTQPSLFPEAQRFSLRVRLYPREGHTRIGFHVK